MASLAPRRGADMLSPYLIACGLVSATCTLACTSRLSTFERLVLEISVVECNKTLHATLYEYELVFIPSGVSVVTLSAEDRPEESIFIGHNFQDFGKCTAGIRKALAITGLTKAALRVPLAVTWLTVYRQLHIMRPGQEQTRWEPKGCVA